MSKTILIIEDNLEVRENTAELLELSGYNVLTAKNGRSGFVITKEKMPDLILCDIMMPDSDGGVFFKLVKNEKKTSVIPLIFFSAGSAPFEVRKGLTNGADEYLPKPFTNEDLLGAVERCLKNNNHN